MDQLCLVQPVDGFGQGIVVAVADAADGGLDARFGQTFGVFDRNILAAAVAMVNKATPMGGPAPVLSTYWAEA
jgi:hypothetical protein